MCRGLFISALCAALIAVSVVISVAISGPALAQNPAPQKGGRVVNLPLDLQQVLGSAIILLTAPDRANADIWPIRYAPKARTSIRDPLFSFAGFSVQRVTVNQYRRRAAAPRTVDATVTVLLTDAYTRRAVIRLTFAYTNTRQGITVETATNTPVAAKTPKFRFFIVPTGRVPNQFWRGNPNFSQTIDQLLRAAIDPRQPNTLPPGRQNYMVVALGLDRMQANEGVVLVAENKAQNLGASPAGAKTYDLNGWPLATLSANFALDDPNAITFKLLYRSNLTRPQAPQLLGQISSQQITN